ncbi:hypothetical protein A2U01_0062970, partial [Trifolium medium]|nr:hypothetical protein [Trifolium medium]
MISRELEIRWSPLPRNVFKFNAGISGCGHLIQ